MNEFPRFKYNMHDVKRAGEALKGDMLWSEARRDELLHIFDVANNWIDSHVLPMVKIRQEAVGKIRRLKKSGITASRLKRMSSVRKKLRRINSNFNQIQDLGGCRIVVPSMKDARELFDLYQQTSNHFIHKSTDYILAPKVGGYRSYHLMFRYREIGPDEVHNDRRVELQIRTRLQHSWATAVEAVGFFRREDLKAGEGSAGWLRLFDLMSAELAEAENCPEAEHLPGHKERVAEVSELNRDLNALQVLDALRAAFQFTDWNQSADPPKFYRIQFNVTTRQVNVQAHYGALSGVADQHGEQGEFRSRVYDAAKIDLPPPS